MHKARPSTTLYYQACTEKVLHSKTFRFCDLLRKKKLHTETVTQRHFYTNNFTDSDRSFYAQQTFTHSDRRFYTHTATFTQRNFYIEKLLHRDASTCSKLLHTLLHRETITQRSVTSRKGARNCSSKTKTGSRRQSEKGRVWSSF